MTAKVEFNIKRVRRRVEEGIERYKGKEANITGPVYQIATDALERIEQAVEQKRFNGVPLKLEVTLTLQALLEEVTLCDF